MRFDLRSLRSESNHWPLIVERVTTQPRLSLLYAVYNSACILSGARDGRGVRAVGVATLNANFRKKAKDKRKKWAVQR